MEYGNVREIFPGIGCAWTEAGGKATAEYYGVADYKLRDEQEKYFAMMKGVIFALK